jgi:DNA-binding transcriptional MerR regulator
MRPAPSTAWPGSSRQAGECPRPALRRTGRARRGQRPDPPLLRAPRLLAAPARRPSGQREYPEDAVALIRAIKAAQRLGFTLPEIDELLAISQHRRGPAELHRRARAKIAEIDARIDHLTRMRQALQTVLAADCDSLTDCSCGLATQLPG